jgi:uncharacterized membrane protein YdjX (TVP38/TMEM64 family)
MKPWKIGVIVLLIVVAAIFRFTPAAEYLSLENLRSLSDLLRNRAQASFWAFSAAYALVYCATIAFSIPGAAVLSVIAGYVFPFVSAVVIVNIGAVAGALLNFLLVRFLAGGDLQAKYAAKAEPFNRHLERNGPAYLIFLRLVPVFPFFLVNILAGLTKISAFDFAWTTAVGILPGSAVFCFAGARLNSIRSVSDIFTLPTYLALGFLAALALVPALYGKKSG